MTDALTGLPTHRDGLRDAILSHGAACCFVDIDGLIWVNDQFGHGEADRALASVAQYLVRFGDRHRASVYRVGGDEFLVLFPEQAGRLDVTEIATQIVSGVRGLQIPYRRLGRPNRTLLEVNVAVLHAGATFADRAFSEFGLTHAARDWVATSIFEQKKRVGYDAGVVVDLLDAAEAPWATVSSEHGRF